MGTAGGAGNGCAIPPPRRWVLGAGLSGAWRRRTAGSRCGARALLLLLPPGRGSEGGWGMAASSTPRICHPVGPSPHRSTTPWIRHPPSPSPLPPSPLPPLILAPRSCSPPFPHTAGVLGSPHPMSDPPRAQHPSPPQDPVTMSWSRPSTPHPSVPPPDTTSSTQPASPGCTVSPPPCLWGQGQHMGTPPHRGAATELGGLWGGGSLQGLTLSIPKGHGGLPKWGAVAGLRVALFGAAGSRLSPPIPQAPAAGPPTPATSSPGCRST